MRVLATGYLHIPEFLLGVRACRLELGHAVNSVDSQRVAVYLVIDCQFERRVNVAPLLLAAHVQARVVTSAVAKPMEQPGITVEIENDRLVDSEETIEIAIAQTVRMVTV